jgi:SAM-dependent methyltransferase
MADTASGSVSFDRAADYYDRTRAIPDETLHATLEVMGRELAGRGPVLEIGVGTGILAAPLAARGLPLVGLDLSRAMLAKIAEKTGGQVGFPLVQGDATRAPFADAAFGAAYCRWVLHLIPDWRSAVAELVRVVRPGGVVVIDPGGSTGAWKEVWLRFVELLGDRARPAGLSWAHEIDRLDAALVELGAGPRPLEAISVPVGDTPAEFLELVRAHRYSWTWNVPDDELAPAADEVERWVQERFGGLHEPLETESETLWRAYDLP